MGSTGEQMRRSQAFLPLGRRACPVGPADWSASGVASAYLAGEQAGASPQRLRMLLYDDMIRLCRQALASMDEGDVRLAAHRLAQAQRNLHQLRDCLRGRPDVPLAGQFLDLYNQTCRGLIDAGFYRRREPITETISLLSDYRAAWRQVARGLDRGADAPDAAGPEVSRNSWLG